MLTPTTTNIADIVEHSFLNQVPEMMANDPSLTIEQAIEKAYYHEEKFILNLIDPWTDQQKAIVRELSDEVYRRIRSAKP